MALRTLLIFDLDGARFGVDAAAARETVWLPELTPAEEAPSCVAGIFSLRGRIVPVVDLRLRLGHPAAPYRLGDQVVVLEADGSLMGLIVGEAREVVEISPDAVLPPPAFDGEPRRRTHLAAGEARVGDELVTLLDARELARPPLGTDEAAERRPAGRFYPQASPAEREIFRARAKTLMEAAVEDGGTRLPLAVVELGGEYFGLEAAAIQEFRDISRTCPIPCCPPRVLGAMSLRGELIALFDVRAALDLPDAAPAGGKAVVARLGERALGVAVDQVHDMVYLREDELQPPPAALQERHGAEVKGAAHYGGKMMAVLDLPALLAREELIVDETV